MSAGLGVCGAAGWLFDPHQNMSTEKNTRVETCVKPVVQAGYRTGDRRSERQSPHPHDALGEQFANSRNAHTANVGVVRIAHDEVVPQYPAAWTHPLPHRRSKPLLERV